MTASTQKTKTTAKSPSTKHVLMGINYRFNPYTGKWLIYPEGIGPGKPFAAKPDKEQAMQYIRDYVKKYQPDLYQQQQHAETKKETVEGTRRFNKYGSRSGKSAARSVKRSVAKRKGSQTSRKSPRP
jgi:hypothetical protein